MSLDILSVDLVSTLRTAPENGAPSSRDYNDTLREFLTDLGSLSEVINTSILPVLNTLPDSAASGLEGRNVYASLDQDKTALFYSETDQKFYTIAEVLYNLHQLLAQSNNQIVDMLSRLTQLSSKLATTSHNDIVSAVQGFTDQVRQVSYSLSGVTRVVEEHAATLAKTQAARQPVALAADETKTIDITWLTPFADNGYTVSLSLEGADAAVKSWTKKENGAGLSVVVENRVSAENNGTILHAVGRAD